MHSESAIWDPVNGVWLEDKAPALHFGDFPTPLYIFGYGSLIWRPGTLLEACPSFPAKAIEYRRVFAQRSYDHRGNSKFPGLVLNLVKDNIFMERGHILQENAACLGLVWLIAATQTEDQQLLLDIIADLDYREKGGYSRHLMEIELLQDTPYHAKHSIVQALVYTGLADNPNFQLPHNNHTGKQTFYQFQYHSSVVDIILAAKGPSGTNVEYLLRLQRFLQLQSIHPSPSSSGLSSTAGAGMLSSSMEDEYISALARAIRLRLGFWRRKYYQRDVKQALAGLMTVTDTATAAIATDTADVQVDTAVSSGGKFLLYGSGSNEFQQLLLSSSSDNNIKKVAASELQQQPTVAPPTMVSSLQLLPITVTIPTSSSSPTTSPSSSFHTDIDKIHLLANGGSSAYLLEDPDHDHDKEGSYSLVVWGAIVPAILAQANKNSKDKDKDSKKDDDEGSRMMTVIEIQGLSDAALGHELLSLSLTDEAASGKIISLSLANDSSTANHDDHHHIEGILLPSSAYRFIEVSQSNSSSNSSSSNSSSSNSSSSSIRKITYRIELLSSNTSSHSESRFVYKPLKLASGYKYSGMITICGGLIIWSNLDNNYAANNSMVDGKTSIWYPPDRSLTTADDTAGNKRRVKLIDIAIGLRHIVVIDDEGYVYTLGDDSKRHGTLGGNRLPLPVSATASSAAASLPAIYATLQQVDLPEEIRFVRVTCGWSHTLVRGVNTLGESICYGWGRSDMFQYLTTDDTDAADSDKDLTMRIKPRLLRPLPGDSSSSTISEIWCGSEYSIVQDGHTGQLYTCGWNEHGNLSCGDVADTDDDNTATMPEYHHVKQWTPMLIKQQQVSSDVVTLPLWEGSLACGGAHILVCIPTEDNNK